MLILLARLNLQEKFIVVLYKCWEIHMKILVTGCSGFIGSWVAQKAVENGHIVVGIDNLSSNVNYTPQKVEFYHQDLNSDLQKPMQGIDAIVHLAAYAQLRDNWKDRSEREKLFKNNELGTLSVLEQMPSVPIIFMSSASVYGSLYQTQKRALTEDDANSYTIESPYAASKLSCESYIAAWAYKKQNPWYALRLVNQVGARTHRGVIVDFCRMVRENKHIHALDNGEQKKSWVSVYDTVDVIMTLLDQEKNIPSGAYNVTSSETWSWRDIVGVMEKMHYEKNPNSQKPFTLSYAEKLTGSVGDPTNIYVSSNKLDKYITCNRSVESAVRDTLTYLKW